MQTIKIFLGSSIDELHDERLFFSDYLLNSVRPIFKRDGVDIEVVKCEDIRTGYRGKSSQEEIIDLLKGCDISVFMFKTKAGPQTVREYNVAQELVGTKNHEIYVFCFGVSEEEKEKSLQDFKQQMRQIELYWKTCKDVSELESQFIIGLLQLKIEKRQQELKQTKDLIAQTPTTVSELPNPNSMAVIDPHLSVLCRPHFRMQDSKRAQVHWRSAYEWLANNGWLWRNEIDYHEWVYVCCGQQKAPDGPVVWHGTTAALAYIVRTKFGGQWGLARTIFCLPEGRSLPSSFRATNNPSPYVTDAIDKAFSFQ